MNKLNEKNTNIKDDKNNTSDIYDRENISYDEQNFFDLSINKKNGIKDSKKIQMNQKILLIIIKFQIILM